jgi:hypothetical protein
VFPLLLLKKHHYVQDLTVRPLLKFAASSAMRLMIQDCPQQTQP